MIDSEAWLPVVGWEGVYEVSSLGNVRRVLEGRGTRGPNWLLKAGTEKGGYLHVTLIFDGRRRIAKIHQLVAAAFIGPRPVDRPEINHKDGNTTNNLLTNLEYCSSSANKLHAYSLGRSLVSCQGMDNGRTKLTEDAVLDIRARYSRGSVSQQKLADEYGVTQMMVSRIVRRLNWSHLPDQ